jgi:hypothetical protein
MALTEMRRTNSPSIASQFRRRFGTRKNAISARAVPPEIGPKSLSIWFFAVDAAVVVTVSVDVCAAVPPMATEVGFRLHVGMSLTFVIDVVTAHVRFTVPLNPFVPTTLIVPVSPVVAPGVTVMEVAPPLPAVKLGSAVIVSAMLVFAVNVPEVPVTVTVTGLEVTAVNALAAMVTT